MTARLVGDRRGAIGVFAALVMPLLLGFTAFAVDIGLLALDTRRLQGIADAAALAGAADPDHAQAAAEASVAASGWSRSFHVVADPGSYARDATTPVASRFAPAGTGDAVRVTVDTTSPSFFGAIFGRHGTPITRRGVAVRERVASLSVGTRLLALQGGVVNAYLSALTGSNVSLSVMSYQSLASADVDLFGYLGALRTSGHLDAVDFSHLVAGRVSQGEALGALATALDAGSQGDAATAMRSLALQVAGSRSLSLSALVDPGPFGTQTSGGAGVARVNALALATAMLQLAGPSRQVSFDAGVTTGLAATRVTIAIGERANQSPWIAVTPGGTPIVRTAQARVYADATLTPVPLPGLTGLVAVHAPVFAELAAGEARLTGIDCASEATRGVSVEARTNPGQAAIASVDPARLADFTTPVVLAPAHLVDTPLIDVDGSAALDLGAAERWQSLRFTAAQIAAGTPQTISSSVPVGGVAASLASRVQFTTRVLGLPIPLSALLNAVGTQLTTAAPGIDALLDLITGSVGVRYGQADVRVTGMRCGMAALVA